MNRDVILAITAVFAAFATVSAVADGGAEAILFQDIPAVVAASRYEQKQREAPSSVNIVTAEAIRGPSVSLRGTTVFFTVVNAITQRGRNLNGGELGGEAATFGIWQTRLSYGHRPVAGSRALI